MEGGQKIRDYVLKSKIGAGGVGEVWRAYHKRLHKEVAIKFILPHHCRDLDIYERFVREAIEIARLELKPLAIRMIVHLASTVRKTGDP